MDISMKLEKCDQRSDPAQRTKYNFAEFRDKETARNFANHNWHNLSYEHIAQAERIDILNDKSTALQAACETAASMTLSQIEVQPKRPWISNNALKLIEGRNKARISKDWNHEKYMTKAIKLSVKADRSTWWNNLIANDSWADIRNLRKPPKHAQGRLLNLTGDNVFSNHRAETLAEYFEKMQWHIRPEAHVELRPKIFDLLPVKLSEIAINEIQDTIAHLKIKKSPGPDNIVPEMWRAFRSNDNLMTWDLDFCNDCWRNAQTPKDWI